jgi:metal-dependent HD superfamily phosphatase/phosphodiesterase
MIETDQMPKMEMSLMQEGITQDKVEDVVGHVEALVIIVLFLVVTHFLGRFCLRKGQAQQNFYEQTEKEVELFNFDYN